NICTAQVLLAVIASMYAVYHGPKGLQRIARRVHRLTAILRTGLARLGFTVENDTCFDTLTVAAGKDTGAIVERAQEVGFNFRRIDANRLGLSLDETTTREAVEVVWQVFAGKAVAFTTNDLDAQATDAIPSGLARTSAFLSHPVFNRFHSETEMLRYLRRLADMDIALDRSMIPLGSCTMKL